MTVIVCLRHVRAIRNDNYCVPGMKTFAKLHGLDFQKFVKEGLPEQEFIKTGDAMAFLVVQEARKEWAAKAAVKQLGTGITWTYSPRSRRVPLMN